MSLWFSVRVRNKNNLFKFCQRGCFGLKISAFVGTSYTGWLLSTHLSDKYFTFPFDSFTITRHLDHVNAFNVSAAGGKCGLAWAAPQFSNKAGADLNRAADIREIKSQTVMHHFLWIPHLWVGDLVKLTTINSIKRIKTLHSNSVFTIISQDYSTFPRTAQPRCVVFLKAVNQ